MEWDEGESYSINGGEGKDFLDHMSFSDPPPPPPRLNTFEKYGGEECRGRYIIIYQANVY
jgi:hypothetical protein